MDGCGDEPRDETPLSSTPEGRLLVWVLLLPRMVEQTLTAALALQKQCPTCSAAWVLLDPEYRQCGRGHQFTIPQLEVLTASRNGHGSIHGVEVSNDPNSFVRPIGDVVPNELRIRFQTAREVSSETPEKVDWVAYPWVAAGSITEVTGKIKVSGKTTWTMSLCAAITTGAPFLGHPTHRTKVVYLTEQSGQSLHAGLARAGLVDSEDVILVRWRDTIGIPWPDVAHLAVDHAVKCGAGVIVVDTIGQFSGLRGESENDSGAALEAMRPLQEAAQLHSIGVVVDRHQRKAGGDVGDSGRGSSAFGGAVDIMLAIRRSEGAARPTIRIIEGVGRFDGIPDELAIEWVDGAYIALGDPHAMAQHEAEEAITAELPDRERALTADELLDKVDIKRTVGREALKELVSRGIASKEGTGRKGNPTRYFRNTSNQPDVDSFRTPHIGANESICEMCGAGLALGEVRVCGTCRAEVLL